jgi:FkbM family methyltransferase
MVLRRLAARLPPFWQQELKRLYYRRQIRRQTFRLDEPEFRILDQFVSAGDWVIDIGASVGHYTRKLSELVGPGGRVIAVEPVPDTFSILAANIALFPYSNVTLLNLAASDQTTTVGIQIPEAETGLKNYYRAEITPQEAELQVMTVAIDSLALEHRIGLVKIDAEGHDPVVLEGMERLLSRDHPTLIVETSSTDVVKRLEGLGYDSMKLPGSPNTLFRRLPEVEKENGDGG